jgi:putative spermidine/putrescine transport system permease protein
MKKTRIWSWVWLGLGMIYFLLPLYAIFEFSLRAKRDEIGFTAYQSVLGSPDFAASLLFSFQAALTTILVGVVLIVPTAYWVQLKLPRLRPLIELCTLLPLVVPAVVLVFGLIRAYNQTFFTNSREGVYWLMIGAYVMLAFPYMYRAIDSGLAAINVRTLTEAAQSLGAGWGTVLVQVIFPNVLTALLNGAFITFAIVMGEFTIAALLSQPAFGPYMNLLSSSRVYEPLAVAVISFALTWAAIGIVQVLSRFLPGGQQTR